jgi:hypothetical protein
MRADCIKYLVIIYYFKDSQQLAQHTAHTRHKNMKKGKKEKRKINTMVLTMFAQRTHKNARKSSTREKRSLLNYRAETHTFTLTAQV